MDKFKRYVDIYWPVTTCTLRCHYCYITHQRLFDNALPKFKYSPETFRKGLSQERLGGVCLLNFGGGGETLLPPEMPAYIKAALEEGHYVNVVTNATVDRAFDEISSFPHELLERLFFKFSYHYLELKNKNLLERFFRNIHKVVDAGASFTLEITPTDELMPFIDEMKETALQNVGAIPHATIARDEHDHSIVPILSNLSPEDYYGVWSEAMKSELFDFKKTVFSQKRTEFCYAGDWSFHLHMATGQMRQCYCSLFSQNIFDDVTKPIKWKAIGHFCQEPHCYNAHGFLTFGTIPSFNAPTYDILRNRVRQDGTEWLNPKMKAYMAQKLGDNNKHYSVLKKSFVDTEMCLRILKRKLSRYIH